MTVEPSTTEKGRVVEGIVAAMHNLPGVKVDRNVRLPARGSVRRKREIDVLISSSVAGYPWRVAIECKNEKARIGSSRIDSFLGKLDDVGIPAQAGIYVSSSDYTTQAIDRAKTAGVRTLILGGLTKDRLASEVVDALKSVVYLILDVTPCVLVDDVPVTMNPPQTLVFCDQTGRPCGSLPDLLWRDWTVDRLPTEIGYLDIPVPIPEQWQLWLAGESRPVTSVTVIAAVLGVVITVPGRAEQHALVNADSREVEKLQTHAVFDRGPGPYPVRTVSSEAELQEALARPAPVTVSIGRIRSPRIRMPAMYWPPSKRVADALVARMAGYLRGEVSDPPPIRFEELEGFNFATVMEPIWSGYSAAGDTGVSPSGGKSRVL